VSWAVASLAHTPSAKREKPSQAPLIPFETLATVQHQMDRGQRVLLSAKDPDAAASLVLPRGSIAALIEGHRPPRAGPLNHP
jgi:hypothetical protein